VATIVLLASPLLGPTVWSPVADELTGLGHAIVLPRQSDEPPHTPDDVIAALLDDLESAGLESGHDVVVVPHSNAGLFIPVLTHRLHIAAVVFVDAGLPPPDGNVPLAPEGFYHFLAGKADRSGLLPPWHEWWGEPIDELFPDRETQRRVEAEARRLPLGYFASTIPVEAGWDNLPGAYLAFGETYSDARAAAAARGWPTVTLPGHHLHMLIDPAGVAGQIDRLVATFGLAHPSSPDAEEVG
jgi:hypothetical protein